MFKRRLFYKFLKLEHWTYEALTKPHFEDVLKNGPTRLRMDDYNFKL